MIRKLEVKGLNNRVDGAWEFNEDLNIITGRNGSGKTTLLKLIWYLISGNLGQAISDIPFRSVSIETDSFSLSIIQTKDEKIKLECEFANQVMMNGNFEIPLRREDNERLQVVGMQTGRRINSLFFPSFRIIEGGFARIPRHIPTDDSGTDEFDLFKRRFAEEATKKLQEAISQFSTALSVYDDHKFITTISTHDIGDLLPKKYIDVYRKTNELHVKLSKEITQEISETRPLDDTTSVLEEIQNRVEQVTKERELLESPLSVLEERILDILQYKGIRVAAGVTLREEDGAIEADKLSAGEKQMLSFLCYNAFSDNTAIFIDEPELSLHIDWQRRLIPTLLEQETGNQFFIATHSPFIYAKYPDKEILLGEDRGGDV